jgi:competence protein ComEC
MAVGEADSTWSPPVKGGQLFRLAGWAEAFDIESQRLMVWTPLLLVVGIWTYFSLTREPPAYLGLALVILCGAALLWPRTARSAKVIVIIALGFAAAQLRTQWVATPLLRAYSPMQTITGHVVDVDVRSKLRFSLTLEITEAIGLPEAERPARVLIQITGKHLTPHVGDTVRLTADLAPLPRPAQPGGFDYGRQLFFQSIGAVGRSKTDLALLNENVPWRFALRRGFHDLRAAIGGRVRQAIRGPIGSFADAVITGERASIPRSMNESLQASGLFHILSISGLHMALVAGGAFWMLRALLALSPRLALQYPIKKWAAGFAIVVGLLYMLLADSGAATERSFIMIAVVFFAVLVDRPALSLHNLALAAVLILLWSPEQALAASFQMSFMAVMGLAAFFVWWKKLVPSPTKLNRGSFVAHWTRRIALGSAASLATSLVAGSLSGIPAMHHFGRLAPYGVVANALALPIVSLIVMPAAMASVILMPLGLEVVPLKFMGWGLQGVMLVSDWVANLPGAGQRLPLIDVNIAAALALAAAFLFLPITRLRMLAVPFAVLAFALLWRGSEKALLLIDERAGNVALVTEPGLVPASPKQGAASVSRWLTQAGDTTGFKNAAKREGWTCSAVLCEANQAGFKIAFILKQPLGIQHCPNADILVSQEPLRRRCKGTKVTIDRFDVWRNGAYAVLVDGRVEHVRQAQGLRPWVYEPRARTATSGRMAN